MPIIIKDFTWTQSDQFICINLPLKGTKARNLDVLNSTEYCKVSYAPFFFECWFSEQVVDEECSAIVSNGVISLKFNKMFERTWPELFHSEFQNKELLKTIRENAITHAGEREAALQKAKADRRAKNKKEALKEQMNIEQNERAHIQGIKDAEKQQTTKEIEIFKELKQVETAVLSQPEHAYPADPPIEQENKLVFNDFEEPIKDNSNFKIEEDLPAPRAARTVQIKFTPRVFPTPQRESTERQEKEWLENQAEAQRFTELPEDLKDLSSNETSLDWLKTKANQLYGQGNYQAALGAYSHAVRLFPKVPALYSNRAACHYKLRNLIKCVEDSTRALELLTPPVSDNAKSRLKAHLRRGSAFCELELYPEGLLDYDAALKIEPENEDVVADAENIRRLIVGAPPEHK